MKKTTITINGRLYDAITGMPVKTINKAQSLVNAGTPLAAHGGPQNLRRFSDIAPKLAPATLKPHRPSTPQAAAATLHAHPQKSTTLNRQAIKKPHPVITTGEQSAPQTPVKAHTRSPLISRFAQNAALQPAPQLVEEDPQVPADAPPQIAPMHPHVAKVLAKRAPPPAQPTGKELKELLIRERLAQVDTSKPKTERKGFFARKPKLASILVSSLSLLILGGYFSYINLTNISMRVAANRAGIDASFPNYRPSGYSIDGPITYAPGEVSINYKSNTNDTGFTLTQKASEWDSQAVLDNFVRKQSSNYLTVQERGITVYTYNSKAVWVNGGLLHTIEGNATLSSDQVLKIATSL